MTCPGAYEKPAIPTSNAATDGTTHPLSLRVPPAVIRAYKAEANRRGIGYQTLMIRTLVAGAQNWA